MRASSSASFGDPVQTASGRSKPCSSERVGIFGLEGFGCVDAVHIGGQGFDSEHDKPLLLCDSIKCQTFEQAIIAHAVHQMAG